MSCPPLNSQPLNIQTSYQVNSWMAEWAHRWTGGWAEDKWMTDKWMDRSVDWTVDWRITGDGQMDEHGTYERMTGK